MGSLFGKKSKQTQTSSSSSSNQYYPQAVQTFDPVAQNAQYGSDAIKALLNGDFSGFNNFKNAFGFDQLVQDGSRGITGNAAASGLLRSGGTGKALINYAGNMNSQFGDKYLNTLQSLLGTGLQAGNLIGGTGNISNSTSNGSSTSSDKSALGGGLLKGIGKVAGIAALSDIRLKKDIVKVGELDDGLGVYQWTYRWDKPGTRNTGVMAQEVEKLRPYALGKPQGGYMTVDYSKIKESAQWLA